MQVSKSNHIFHSDNFCCRFSNFRLQFSGRLLGKRRTRVAQKRNRRQQNEDGNDAGTNWVRNLPVKPRNQQRRNNDAARAQSVGQDVQIHALSILVAVLMFLLLPLCFFVMIVVMLFVMTVMIVIVSVTFSMMLMSMLLSWNHNRNRSDGRERALNLFLLRLFLLLIVIVRVPVRMPMRMSMRSTIVAYFFAKKKKEKRKQKTKKNFFPYLHVPLLRASRETPRFPPN